MIKLLLLLGSAIPALIAGMIAWFGRKFSVAAATILTMVLLTAAMIACINAILGSILAVLSLPAWVSNSIGMFIPADFGAVLGAIVSAKICRAAYDLAMDKARALNSAS